MVNIVSRVRRRSIYFDVVMRPDGPAAAGRPLNKSLRKPEGNRRPIRVCLPSPSSSPLLRDHSVKRLRSVVVRRC